MGSVLSTEISTLYAPSSCGDFYRTLMIFQTNVLVNGDGRVRIAGLGMASALSTMPAVDVYRFFHGVAPELIDPQRWGLHNAGATMASLKSRR